jgi:protein involved in polysaccharide export with SLBB domain
MQNPARYLMKEPMTASHAIQMAGGALPDAEKVNVLLCSRSNSETDVKILSFDVNKIGKERSKDVDLGPNDIVQVRSRFTEPVNHLVTCVKPQLGTQELTLREMD